jgi:hypothetical protein
MQPRAEVEMTAGMTKRAGCLVVVTTAIVIAAALPSTAFADGLPVLGIDVGTEGVTMGASPQRYVALHIGGATVVAQTARRGGRVLRYLRVPATFTIPAVAYDGSAGGLSADERTLVLIQPRVAFPRHNTTFAVVSTARFAVTHTFTLSGDYSFDAISRDGGTIFLIQYTSVTDPTRYAVRAYDLAAGRMLARPIVDPRERGDAMRGSPITRTASLDGRWAYTLYDGAGGTPFVHALDTSTKRARCIDLPMLAGLSSLWQVRLGRAKGGSELRVGTADSTLALISTNGFRVTVPPAATGGSTSGVPWLLAAAAALAAVLVAAAIAVAVRRVKDRPLAA